MLSEATILEALEEPYLLLTPGPLTTTPTVRIAMLRDWCTWETEYNHGVVQEIRRRLIDLATTQPGHTATLMQGSGTFGVEATIGTALGSDDRLLVLTNGAYGDRIAQIARVLGIDHRVLDFGETSAIDPDRVAASLDADPKMSHVAFVHVETTTGRLNPLEAVAEVATTRGRTLIVDAMSSFGGIPIDVADLGIDFLVSSANKCIQGVPGFSFTVAPRTAMERIAGRARSLSLDLHAQWRTMEEHDGKWRFTSPTHVTRAFLQALHELEGEGGPEARHRRYRTSQRRLVEGMRAAGFTTLLPDDAQSPIITSFLEPPDFAFDRFYRGLRRRGFVIYPGKVTSIATFRVGTIGDLGVTEIEALLDAVAATVAEDHS